MKTRPTTDFRHFQYFHRGLRWIRIFAGVIEEWRPAVDEWVFVDQGIHPGPTWTEFTAIDQLKEELAACSAMVHALETQVAEQRETIKRQRAKNSALRKERWEAKRSTMFDMTAHHSELPLRPLAWKHKEPAPAAAAETRRWYHRDDGFTGGIKFFEIHDGRVFSDRGEEHSHTAKSWEYAATTFVPDGLWIEVRGTDIPSNLPKPPPVPKGFTHWEYHVKWKKGSAIQYAYFDGVLWVTTRGYPAGLYDHYLEAKGPEVVVSAGTSTDKLVGLKSLLTQEVIDAAVKDASQMRQMIFATPNPNYVSAPREDVTFKLLPAPKTRIFRSVKGFGDDTDRVEVYPNGEGSIVQTSGKVVTLSRGEVGLLDPEGALRAGQWYEVFDDSAHHRRVHLQQYAEVVARDYTAQRDVAVRAALIHKFGKLPSTADCLAHLHRVIDHNKVEHWLWLDNPLQIGEKAPLNKAICRINPPSFGPYGKPQLPIQ